MRLPVACGLTLGTLGGGVFLFLIGCYIVLQSDVIWKHFLPIRKFAYPLRADALPFYMFQQLS